MALDAGTIAKGFQESGNVLPRLPSYDAVNRSDSDAESLAQTGERCSLVSESPDFNHRLCGQFSGPLPFASRPFLWVSHQRVALAGCRPALGAHVGHVVCMCPKEEMGRVHADRVVAAVKHKESAWNFTIQELPRHSMGGTLEPTSNLKRAVRKPLVSEKVGGPKPATGDHVSRDGNLRPEAFVDWDAHVSEVSTPHGTRPPRGLRW